jgi:hypothetical protein
MVSIVLGDVGVGGFVVVPGFPRPGGAIGCCGPIITGGVSGGKGIGVSNGLADRLTLGSRFSACGVNFVLLILKYPFFSWR